jgi:curved DNA-binding protein CbpA
LPAQLVPEDDLYATLELGTDAPPEAIELAWRALLKRHHPDVAGEDAAALDRAKRINVAHDWLSDPDLRARYDADRLGLAPLAAGRPRRPTWRPRGGRNAWARPPGAHAGSAAHAAHAPRSNRPDLVHGDPATRFARFIERVERLTPDELDRLAAAEPPPIAFLATVQRFLPLDAKEAFAAAERELARRVAHERWAEVGLREGLLGVAAELILAAFLDDLLAEPFRSRARDRLLRAWDASIDQPRYGPNGDQVAAVRDRTATMTREEVASFLRASQGIAGDDRPWPDALDRDEDEALRISAFLAARDVSAAIPIDGLAPATATRARRLAARLGHVTALRHAFASPVFAGLVGPWTAATRGTEPGRPAPGPEVRRAR